MPQQAARAAEKQGLAQFPGMGVGERQHQPSIRNKSFELFSFTLRLGTADLLFPIVLDADTFQLAFTGAGFTGINDRPRRAMFRESLSPGTSRSFPQVHWHHQ